MRRLALAAIITASLALLSQTAQASEQIGVAELIESAAQFDGDVVIVQGELVGDYGFRGDGWMWAQLNDDRYVSTPIREGGPPLGGNTGIGVRMPADLGRELDSPGRYRTRGPIVRITGIWRYHDEERQGESYLDVETVTVVEPGRVLSESADATVMVIGVVLLGLATVLWLTRSRD